MLFFIVNLFAFLLEKGELVTRMRVLRYLKNPFKW
jgi:hypothetical protein